MASVNYLAYKNALKQAWKDGKMSADESAMLDTLRKSLNISAEEHIHIEREVRNELAGLIPEMPKQIEGINNANGGTAAVVEEPVVETPAPVEQDGKLSHDELFDSNDIKQLLVAGKNSYHKGNFEEAIEFCDKVLLLEPDNSEALFFRKRTLSKIEKTKGKKGKVPTEGTDEEATSPAPKEKTATKQDAEKIEAAIDEIADMKLDPVEIPEIDKTNPENPKPDPSGGDPNCKSCGGSGTCHWCQGSGKCYWCKGSGKCDKCGGKGEINGEECKSCKGSGKCHSCNGDSDCYWCKGSGKCSKCSL